MKANIKNFTDEMEYYPGIDGVGVFAELNVSYQPDVWVMLADGISYPTFMIQDPTGINESNYYYLAQMPLFLPLGLNFGQIASWINSDITGLEPIYNNVTVTGLSNGLRATVLGSFLEWLLVFSGAPFSIPTLSNVVVEVTWNEKGVFSSASLAYGGLTLVTSELLEEEEEEIPETPEPSEIPGYKIPIILGISSVALIAIIYHLKRKNNIIK